jgi:hypothetical protein
VADHEELSVVDKMAGCFWRETPLICVDAFRGMPLIPSMLRLIQLLPYRALSNAVKKSERNERNVRGPPPLTSSRLRALRPDYEDPHVPILFWIVSRNVF